MISLSGHIEAWSNYIETGDTTALVKLLRNPQDIVRAGVYRNGALKTAATALAANFPSVEAAIGAERFKRLAIEYMQRFPISTGTLTGYGQQFPDHVAATLATHGLGYLEDLAKLDLAWIRCCFARDVECLTPEIVAALGAGIGDSDEYVITLAPTACLVGVSHRIVEIWSQLRAGEISTEIVLLPEPGHVLVWRLDRRVAHRWLDPADADFVLTLAQGGDIQQSTDAAIQRNDSFDLTRLFAALLDARLLVANPVIQEAHEPT